jgi:hypothetical protein
VRILLTPPCGCNLPTRQSAYTSTEEPPHLRPLRCPARAQGGRLGLRAVPAHPRSLGLWPPLRPWLDRRQGPYHGLAQRA